MMNRSSSRNSLEPPRKSVELQDPGAAGLESSDGEEYFSDASEGRRQPSRPITPSSPIPTTRVERIDDRPSYGEQPGTDAYQKRSQDAVPDEVELVPEGRLSKNSSDNGLESAANPGGATVPRTVVEKLDPDEDGYGDVPGTDAYRKRQADATPDVVLKNPDPSKGSRYEGTFDHRRTPSSNIPKTVVTRVDDEPAYGEVDGTHAKQVRAQDATPDRTEVDERVAGSPTLDRSMSAQDGLNRDPSDHPSKTDDDDDDDDNDNDDGFGDDFDDFEEGAQASADDDFGDFDDGFQEPDGQLTPRLAPQKSSSDVSFPLIQSDALDSLSELILATTSHLDTMFPTTTAEQPPTNTKSEPIPADNSIFPSDRSRSLWKQLITPPPLQPPNWTQSRIRRLFLISLGVPVDLDEILPPSKQKKLILPDINLDSGSKSQMGDKSNDSIARLKSSSKNDSSASIATSTASSSKTRTRRSASRTTPNAPTLDLAALRRTCATTDEKLDGLTDQELQKHVEELDLLMKQTQEALEYWLKRRDGLRKEKEAFEGVIENLVRHARRVRK